MVAQESVAAQLRKIGFNEHAWGRQEVRELPNIILPDEEIFECVNGIYEGGFALLVATDVRVLLIDKKPFNYLTVEDLRFDMINEIDYNHRAFGAYVDITTGNRELKFRSYNQQRLRKLINHVQHRMAEIKKQQDSHQAGQNQHLEQINGHLRTYLLAQYKHQEELQRRLDKAQRKEGTAAADRPSPGPRLTPVPPRPSPELADYLLAHGLLEEHRPTDGQEIVGADAEAEAEDPDAYKDLYTEGRREVFGPRTDLPSSASAAAASHNLDTNSLRIAYSKLPMAMRNRKFGRPSLHAHSQADSVALDLEVQPDPQYG